MQRWEVPTRAVQGAEGDPTTVLRAGSLGSWGSGEGLTHSPPSEAQGKAPVGCSGLGVWGHRSRSEARPPPQEQRPQEKATPRLLLSETDTQTAAENRHEAVNAVKRCERREALAVNAVKRCARVGCQGDQGASLGPPSSPQLPFSRL